MINMNFYSETEGITMTSANHLCNIAKEYLASQKAIVDNISFVTTTTSVRGSAPVINCVGDDNLDIIENALMKIAKFNAFIAYMREAIKGKKEMTSGIISRETFLKINDLWPKKYPNGPIKDSYISEEDILQKKSIKEQNEYWRLEALASVLGKAIHPDGTFANARSNMYYVISHPSTINGENITTSRVSIEPERVDTLYFKLQKLHRETEAKLNAIKHAIEMEVKKYNDLVDAKYSEDCSEYRDLLAISYGKYTAFVNSEHVRIQKLKIIIPNDLKETYEFLSNL